MGLGAEAVAWFLEEEVDPYLVEDHVLGEAAFDHLQDQASGVQVGENIDPCLSNQNKS